jgi:anhydro-N-acetylmuramic acid kinase
MNSAQKYTGIGLMSGTSLDGLDIIFCEFDWKGINSVDYDILNAENIPFPDDLFLRLRDCIYADSLNLKMLDNEFGKWMGEVCISFINKNNISPDFIASHGHTVFHQPEKGMTYQIGNGNILHSLTGIPVIYDFRTLDVALGGQGAPLVPIGDSLLFNEYQVCINLGGFANISFEENRTRKAYDIGAINIVLNPLAQKLGKPYDPQGGIARSGKKIDPLLEKLNSLPFYNMPYPKSLGKEWVDENITPILESGQENVEDLLRTYSEHIAQKIASDINKIKSVSLTGSACNVLITGGGAYNTFIIELIKQYLAPDIEIKIPDKQIIDYKEALIFSFMGLMRLKGVNNCLSSVTGAERDSCSGIIAGVA